MAPTVTGPDGIAKFATDELGLAPTSQDFLVV